MKRRRRIVLVTLTGAWACTSAPGVQPGLGSDSTDASTTSETSGPQATGTSPSTTGATQGTTTTSGGGSSGDDSDSQAITSDTSTSSETSDATSSSTTTTTTTSADTETSTGTTSASGTSTGSTGLDPAAACDDAFGDALEYLFCSADLGECTIAVRLNQSTCNAFCESYGESCLAAYDNAELPADPCEPLNTDDDCDTERGTEICVCTLTPT